jgi:hypothetical protein
MGVLAGRAALVTGGSHGIDKRIRGAPDPDGAAVVLSFVGNRTPLSRSRPRWRRPVAVRRRGTMAARPAAVGGPE